MGTSTDAQICYGIAFEDGFQFPWDVEEYEYDVDVWWREVNGFKHKLKDPYDEDGNYKEGVDKEYVSKYHGESIDWEKENPLPVEVVIHCSYDYPMYILAVKSSFLRAYRGYPETFDPEELQVSWGEKQQLLNFCETYNIEYDEEPQWYLSSLWG